MDSGMPPQPHQEPPPMAQLVGQTPSRRPRRRLQGCGILLVVMLLVALGGSILANVALVGFLGLSSLDPEDRVRERFFSHNERGGSKIAVISVEGAILDGDGFVKRQINRAGKDDDIKAVVLRVDSPGGTITGSDFLYHHLCQLRKESEIPIVVSMGGIAASGGYYVSMAVGDAPDSIFAEPTTWTGSIGVVIPHYDLSGLLAKWGVEEDSVASHRLKTMGSFAKPMTEEERQIFDGLVAAGFDRFKNVIKQGRPKFKEDPAELDKLATGQVYTAQQALEAGLVDKIGFVEDAIERAIELASLDPDDVRVVRYKREPNLGDILMGARFGGRRSELAALLDMTAPRGYYLCTWLPALASSRDSRDGTP